MQAQNTTIVIDSPFFVPQASPMLTHDEIREELLRQIDAKKVTQADVARKLCVAPARIAEIKRGARKIQPDEMPKLAAYLGLLKDSSEYLTKIQSVSQIFNMGKVAQGVWLQESTDDTERKTVTYDRRLGDPSPQDLFAVTPEGNSMNLRFMPGTQLICRKIPFGLDDLRSGDYVVAARTRHDLRELTCKRLEISADGIYSLHSESTDERFAKPWVIGKPDVDNYDDREIQVIGRVIRAIQDFERGAAN